MGEKNGDHFVISKLGSASPEFLLRSDGAIFQVRLQRHGSRGFGMCVLCARAPPRCLRR